MREEIAESAVKRVSLTSVDSVMALMASVRIFVRICLGMWTVWLLSVEILVV